MAEIKPLFSDLSFEAHWARQLACIDPVTIRQNAAGTAASKHYHFEQGYWKIGVYLGCGILAMVGDHPLNAPLTSKLIDVQDILLNGFEEGTWYALPAPSFHQTVANMLSADRFERNIMEPGLVVTLPEYVRAAFADMESNLMQKPVRMRIAGLGIFGTAIAAVGVFENEQDYHRIISIRKSFYGDPRMFELDVRLTRPFVAHITLGYFGSQLEPDRQSSLVETIEILNRDFEQNNFHFLIDRVGLYRYDHLSAFKREEHYPTLTI